MVIVQHWTMTHCTKNLDFQTFQLSHSLRLRLHRQNESQNVENMYEALSEVVLSAFRSHLEEQPNEKQQNQNSDVILWENSGRVAL